MSRQEAISAIETYFDQGHFFDDLARRIAIPSTSQEPDKRDIIQQRGAALSPHQRDQKKTNITFGKHHQYHGF